MRNFRGKAVKDPTSPRQNKEAIDVIFRAANPEYLMILGAPDVVPHQDMANPAYSPPADDATTPGFQKQYDWVSVGAAVNKPYGVRGISSGQMPHMGIILTKAQIEAIIRYERSL